MNRVDRMYKQIDLLEKYRSMMDDDCAKYSKIVESSTHSDLEHNKEILKSLKIQRDKMQDEISGLEYDIEELLMELE